MILLEKSTKVETTTKHKDRYENISCNAVPAAFALLTIDLVQCISHAETASSSANQQIGSTSSGVQTEVTTDENLLDQIPRWVDATPTIFPEQSMSLLFRLPNKTEDQTWVDRAKKIRNWADRTSEKLIIGLVKLIHKTS